jgi:hypothetical protein
MPGANNDLNILDCSPLFKQHLLVEGTVPKVTFTVANSNYDMAYYLTDGIYPDWALFMKTISEPISSIKQQHFSEQQEARRKDVDHGFDDLQVCGLPFVFCIFSYLTLIICFWFIVAFFENLARWRILALNCHLWSADMMGNIITC